MMFKRSIRAVDRVQYPLASRAIRAVFLLLYLELRWATFTEVMPTYLRTSSHNSPPVCVPFDAVS